MNPVDMFFFSFKKNNYTKKQLFIEGVNLRDKCEAGDCYFMTQLGAVRINQPINY